MGTRRQRRWFVAPFKFLGRMWWGLCVWLVVLVFGIGLFLIWRMPLAAWHNDVEQSDLVLRCLDSHETEPLYLFRGYRAAVAAVVIEPLRELASDKMPSVVRPRDLAPDRVETVQKGPHQYEHTILPPGEDHSSTAPVTVTSTTPHTLIPPEQLAAARQGIDTLYPPQDQAARQRLLEWGEALFVQWWAAQLGFGSSDRHIAIAPERGTEEEQLWFAWQKLTDGNPRVAEDLPRLALLVRQAYPEEADYQAAVAWARTWYARQQQHFLEYRTWLESQGLSEEQERVQRSLQMVLPPATEATWHWLLYQFVGLDDASRQAARERWLDLFGHDKLDLALRWGADLEQQRRSRDEPLPPSSEAVRLMCVVERLAGTDDYGQRCRRGVWEATGDYSLFVLSARVAAQIAYPSDDVYYVLCGGNPLELGVYGSWTDLGQFGQVLSLLILIALLSLCFREWLFGFFGAWVLWLGRNPRFLQYRARETQLLTWDATGLFCAYVLVPLATWGLAWWTLSESESMLLATPWHLLVGVYFAVLVGGTLLVCINRIMSLLFIRFGYDVEKGWWDDLCGGLLGIVVLRYFGNDILSLAAFVFFAGLPEVLRRLKRKAPEAKASSLAAATTAGH